ncbi:MAG: hypothetical protein H6828_09800 [Planctomycetes bacterium]|nr:hypothetical protein [Planctomycetota bacterium]
MAERLAAVGVRRFDDLAGLDPDDVARLAADIEVPEKRIAREGWVDAARELVRAREA